VDVVWSLRAVAAALVGLIAVGVVQTAAPTEAATVDVVVHDPSLATPSAMPGLAPATEANAAIGQVVGVSVRGGDLYLAEASTSLSLVPVSGSPSEWAADLPPVRLVDARGTLEGWRVMWSLTALQVDGKVAGQAGMWLIPQAPDVVAGAPEGLALGRCTEARDGARSLLSASKNHGGGTYEAGAKVRVRLPDAWVASEVRVRLAFTVS